MTQEEPAERPSIKLIQATRREADHWYGRDSSALVFERARCHSSQVSHKSWRMDF